jgi:hypothetical protein
MCPTLLWDVRERPGHDSARLCVGYQVPTSHMWALRVSAQHYHDSLKVTQLREETGSVEAVCRFVVGEQGCLCPALVAALTIWAFPFAALAQLWPRGWASHFQRSTKTSPEVYAHPRAFDYRATCTAFRPRHSFYCCFCRACVRLVKQQATLHLPLFYKGCSTTPRLEHLHQLNAVHSMEIDNSTMNGVPSEEVPLSPASPQAAVEAPSLLPTIR